MEIFTKETFVQRLEEKGYVLTKRQQDQFAMYAKMLASWNEKMNLTAIVEEHAVYEKHFYDSLLPFLTVEAKTLCDVGAGAGFPSIPVKILHPELEVVILEPLAKRIRFLEELCEELQLSGVRCLHERAEDYALKHRESFDIVSARAVAALPVLSELCLPLVKVGGLFIAMKGPGAKEEVLLAQQAIEKLGACLEKQEETRLSDGSLRINLFYRKQRETDKRYPRNYGQIKKHPL